MENKFTFFRLFNTTLLTFNDDRLYNLFSDMIFFCGYRHQSIFEKHILRKKMTGKWIWWGKTFSYLDSTAIYLFNNTIISGSSFTGFCTPSCFLSSLFLYVFIPFSPSSMGWS